MFKGDWFVILNMLGIQDDIPCQLTDRAFHPAIRNTPVFSYHIDFLNDLASFLLNIQEKRGEQNQTASNQWARCGGCIRAGQVRGGLWSEGVFKELRQA